MDRLSIMENASTELQQLRADYEEVKQREALQSDKIHNLKVKYSFVCIALFYFAQ